MVYSIHLSGILGFLSEFQMAWGKNEIYDASTMGIFHSSRETLTRAPDNARTFLFI